MRDEEQPKEALVAELARLREQERHYRTISQVSCDFFYCSLRRGISPYAISWVEGAVERITGFAGAELLGAPLGRDYIHPDDLPAVQAFYTGLASGQAGEQEFRIVRKDGSVRFVRESCRCEPAPDPQDLCLYGSVRDITGSRQAILALKQSESRFKSLFDNIPAIAVQGYDACRRVIYWNAASERLYGFGADEAMGRRLEELIIPDAMRAEVVRAVERWVSEDVPIEAGELTLARKDGSPVPVYSSHVMQRVNGGELEMFCLDVDLTELNRAREELLAAKEAAERASHAKSEFLANMSHELRTPLNGIMGMLQLLQTTTLPEQQEEFAQAALHSCRRLTRLLSNILDVCRVDAGQVSLRSEPFSPAEAVRHVCELFAPLPSQPGVTLSCHLDERLPPCVVGDAARLQQVLSNLVGNALKFTRQGGVQVEAYPLPPRAPGQVRVLFSVTDTGVGIEPEKLAQLFAPFTQGFTGYTREFQGAGLGLAISKRLVDLMGGDILIDSEPGAGTSVHFCATFGQAGSCPETASPQPGAPRPRPRLLSILLAEDEPLSRRAAERQLTDAGYLVHAVKDGAQALAALREADFDVVLMDVRMPSMDGVEAARRIRRGEAGASKAGVPIVALNAYGLAGDCERLTGLGVNACVDKPFEMDLLQGVLRSVLPGPSRT